MTNILMSVPAFHTGWAYPALAPYIHPGMKAAIAALSYGEGWISDIDEWRMCYGKGQREYEEIVQPFLACGLREKDIAWINYVEDTPLSAAKKILDSDILFLTGGYPDWMLQRMYDLEIKNLIRDYEGVVIGVSAGAMVQLDLYHLTPEDGYEYQYQEGLGMLGGFDVEVHYEEDLRHIEAIIRTLEDTGRAVVAMDNQSGLLIDGDHLELLGNAFILDMNDLDELYQTYDGLRFAY